MSILCIHLHFRVDVAYVEATVVAAMAEAMEVVEAEEVVIEVVVAEADSLSQPLDRCNCQLM